MVKRNAKNKNIMKNTLIQFSKEAMTINSDSLKIEKRQSNQPMKSPNIVNQNRLLKTAAGLGNNQRKLNSMKIEEPSLDTNGQLMDTYTQLKPQL